MTPVELIAGHRGSGRRKRKTEDELVGWFSRGKDGS